MTDSTNVEENYTNELQVRHSGRLVEVLSLSEGKTFVSETIGQPWTEDFVL